MKKIGYVFCHGFGCDASFWTALKPYFKEAETFYCDLGYFGEVLFPEDIDLEKFDYIAVGHSLGLVKLLSLPIPWTALIGLHGFVNFLGYDAKLRAKRTRELQGLLVQFERSPIATLKQFYQRTGVEMSPHWRDMHEERLLMDLASLTTAAESLSQNILLLGSRDDVIVPPEVLQDNVNACPHIQLRYIDSAKHALGYVAPDVVYREIKFVTKHLPVE